MVFHLNLKEKTMKKFFVFAVCCAAVLCSAAVTVYRNGKDLFVQSRFSATHDIVIQVWLDANEKAWLVPRNSDIRLAHKGLLLHSNSDEYPATSFSHYGFLSGNHGSAAARLVTAPGHGFTPEDSGKIITDEKKNSYVLIFATKNQFVMHPEPAKPAPVGRAVFFRHNKEKLFFNGKEIKCEISFTDGKNLAPVVFDSDMKTVSGIGCESKLEINEPNGDSFTVNVITYPRDGRIKIEEGGRVSYVPNPDFSGKDTLVYTVTDCFGATSERATLLINVEENESKLVFADMQDSADHLYAYRVCSADVMVYRITDGKYYFDPEAAVSKIEFLVMMMNAAGLDAEIAAVADSAVSDDAALSSGLKGYLSAANEQNLIKLDNGAFAPFEKITVADAAYMISAALKLPETNSESVSTGTQDRTLSAILAASKAGFFESLSPSHTLTKQETANALCRMIDYINENNIPLS